MKHSLLDHLVCPSCKQSLELEVVQEERGQVRSGLLRCSLKGCQFPISNFVPRFVDEDLYADSFSRQRLYVRRHFKYYERDQSGYELLHTSTGFSREAFKAGLTLEVGCGYGRFVDVVHSYGGEVVGVDLSTHSINLAQDFVGLKKNVHLIQCDLYQLPFREECFDRIYSIGVLHHTPNPRDAFQAIVPYLVKNGQISIWVYPPEMKRSSNRWRRLTTKLPHSVLYVWCIINQAVFSWVRRLPGGWRFNSLVPGCVPRKGKPFWLRVMSDFDDLSPMHASTHLNEEVGTWFQDSCLQSIRVLSRPTSLTGVRG